MKRPVALPIFTLLLLALICPALAANASLAQRKHKHHHLLLFMGGLKSLAALVLIKIKIVLVVGAIIAVAVFTIKYLLGPGGLPELLHKAPPPPPPPPPQYPAVLHGPPVYGHGYETPIPWDHNSHDRYGNNWSKIGNGGRSLLDIVNLYPNLGEVLLQNFFNHRRKRVKRKSRRYT